ncbi:ras family-domain-containing protein [Astrocystis sublimbata]|nr:ras family-domain-containing protein [Astrocystis sublimbata]
MQAENRPFRVVVYDPTIEDSFRTIVEIDGRVEQLEIIDTAGQEDYRYLQDRLIGECEAIIVVYSLTLRSSFQGVKSILHNINISDRASQQQVEVYEGHDLAMEHGCEFIETSAKYNKNIQKAFSDLVKKARQKPLVYSIKRPMPFRKGGCTLRDVKATLISSSLSRPQAYVNGKSWQPRRFKSRGGPERAVSIFEQPYAHTT